MRVPGAKKNFFLFFVAAACTPPAPPPGAAGPAEAVQSFSEAVRHGDAAAAWSLLSQRTQAQADALAAAARAGRDAGPESGRQMLFSSALPGRSEQAKEVSRSGDSAEVQTTEKGAQTTWHVVREGGRWRLDLDLARK